MDGRVRYGLSLANRGVLFGATTVPELLTLAETADTSGFFDSVWVGDSLLAKPRLEAMVLLGALAARTRRVRLGTACMASFPLRNAIVLAAQWASRDVIAAGRMILTVCLGGAPKRPGAFAGEYRALHIAPRSRVSRLEEGMAVLRTLWQQEPASFHGKHYDFEGISLQPKPVQQPTVPIWIASNPDPEALAPTVFTRALQRVAELADGWMATSVDAATFAHHWRQIQDLASAAGRDPANLESSIHAMVNINPDQEVALAEARRFLETYYDIHYTQPALDAWVAYGAPESVAAKILSYVREGCQTPILRFVAFDQKHQLRLFLDQVAPLLQAALL